MARILGFQSIIGALLAEDKYRLVQVLIKRVIRILMFMVAMCIINVSLHRWWVFKLCKLLFATTAALCDLWKLYLAYEAFRR